MALREYRCKCGRVDFEIFKSSYPKTIRCRCGRRMKYRFGAASFTLAFRGGWDDGAGRYFTSERKRSNWIAEHGLRRRKD